MLQSFFYSEDSKSVNKRSGYGSFGLHHSLARTSEPNIVELPAVPGIWTRHIWICQDSAHYLKLVPNSAVHSGAFVLGVPVLDAISTA